MLHDGFGIDEAVRGQADWLDGAGYLALSVDLGFWGRPSACLLGMFRDLRVGRGQTVGQVDAARAWLAGQPGCDGRVGVIGFCATGGFALLMAAGHGFSVSGVNYGLVRKDAKEALHGACPIVASFGGRDRFLRTAPRRLGRALEALGIDHDIKGVPGRRARLPAPARGRARPGRWLPGADHPRRLPRAVRAGRPPQDRGVLRRAPENVSRRRSGAA